MKIPIKTIEKITKGTVKLKATSVGFDVAERYTGICVLRSDNEYVYMDDLRVIETNPKEDTVHRMERFHDSIVKYKETGLMCKEPTFRIVVVEDCWFGCNVNTLKHLARFSAIVFLVFRTLSDSMHFILPNSARAKIKFNQKKQQSVTKLKGKLITRGKNKGKRKKLNVKDLVKEYLMSSFKVEIHNTDEADAFVLALCGLLM